MNIGVYYSVSWTETRCEIATIHNMKIIYGDKKGTLESLEN